MTLSAFTTSPLYPAAGTPVALSATSDAYAEEDIVWSLTAVPSLSKLALGRIVENHPTVARTGSVPLVFHPAVTLTAKPAYITRTAGSFVVDGFTVGAQVAISGTASNDRTVTIAAVSPLSLTLTAADVLTAESVTATLTGAYQPTGNASNVFVPDTPGSYTILAQEVFVLPAIGAYPGDPLSVEQRILKSTSSFTLYVGTALDLPIAPTNGHTSTLRVVVVNDTVRAASLVNPATELARIAALDSTVAAAVTALVGVAVNSIDVDFVTDVNALAVAYEAHRVFGPSSVHNSTDTVNALLRETAGSIPAAIERLNDTAAKMRGHLEATSSGGTWHNVDDNTDTLQVSAKATTLGEAIVLKADLRERVYERHRVSFGVTSPHDSADNTNVMDAPEKLPSAIVAYLDFIASGSPSAPAGESEGVADAQAAWGFRLTA